MKDPEEVTNKMNGSNIDIKVSFQIFNLRQRE